MIALSVYHTEEPILIINYIEQYHQYRPTFKTVIFWCFTLGIRKFGNLSDNQMTTYFIFLKANLRYSGDSGIDMLYLK